MGHCANAGGASNTPAASAAAIFTRQIFRRTFIYAPQFGAVPPWDAGCSSPDEPANSFLPFARVTGLALHTCSAFFAREPVTVTVSPTFIEWRVQPRRIKPFGLASSQSQFTMLPLSSFASK